MAGKSQRFKFLNKLKGKHKKKGDKTTIQRIGLAGPSNTSVAITASSSSKQDTESQVQPTMAATVGQSIGCSSTTAISFPGGDSNANMGVSDPTNPQTSVPEAPRDYWKIAYELAREKLDPSERKYLSQQNTLQDGVYMAIKDVKDKQSRIEQQELTGSIRARLKSWLERILTTLDKYAKIVDVAVQHSPEVTTLVWAAFRLCLQVSLDHLHLNDALQGAIQQILRVISRGEFYASILETAAGFKPRAAQSAKALLEQIQDALPTLYAAVLVFSVKAYTYLSSNNFRKAGYALEPFQLTFQPLLADIDAEEGRLEKLAGMVSMQSIADISDSLSKKGKLLEEIVQSLGALKIDITNQNENLRKLHDVKEKVERILTEEDKDLIRRFRRWLDPMDSSVNFRRAVKARATSTCQWALKKQIYLQWQSFGGEAKHVVIPGKPGAGKTVLAAALIEDVRKKLLADTIFIYHLFRDGDTKSTSAVQMMRALLDQLVDMRVNQQQLLPIMERMDTGKPNPSEDFDLLWALFIEMAKALDRRVLVIVDALDECVDREAFTSNLLAEASLPEYVRFLITTRRQGVDIFLENKCHPLFQELPMEVNEDIEQFVALQADKSPRIRVNKDEIVDTIRAKAEGMFRYAVLLLNELSQPSRRSVTDTLKSLPYGLDGMYDRILERLAEEDPHPSRIKMRSRILLWTTISFHPITAKEVAYACSTEDEEDIFNPKEKFIATEAEIQAACGPLIEISTNGEIRFTHFSVKEYLIRPWMQKSMQATALHGRLPDWPKDEKEAHAAIALTCFTQLSVIRTVSSSWVSPGSSDTTGLENLDDLHSLPANTRYTPSRACLEELRGYLLYPAMFWFRHAKKSGDDHLLWDFVERQLCSRTWPLRSYIIVIRSFAFSLLKYSGKDEPLWRPGIWQNSEWDFLYREPLWNAFLCCESSEEIPPLALYAACAFGLPPLVSRLTQSPEYQAGLDSSILSMATCLAVAGDHEDIATYLVNEFATKSNFDDSLVYAAERSNEFLIRLLLRNGTDVNSKSSVICIHCHRNQFVALELPQGPFGPIISVQDSRLVFSRTCGYKTVSCTGQPTALHWAINRQNITIVMLLLAEGAQCNIVDDEVGSPLHLAVGRPSNMNVVLALLDNGANPNLVNRDGTNVLAHTLRAMYQDDWGCSENYIKITEQLLSREATLPNNYKEIEVLAASCKYAAQDKNISVFTTMLEHLTALSPCSDSDIYLPAMAQAVESNFIDGLRLLLKYKFIISLINESLELEECNDFWPIASLAMVAGTLGNIEALQILLENGADVNLVGECGTALGGAAYHGKLDAMRYLLENGADVNLVGGSYGTALGVAAYARELDAMHLLLENGADVNLIGGELGTALGAAAVFGGLDAMQLLLNNSADVNLIGGAYGTVLGVAAGCGEPGAMRLLLENGADVNLVGGTYGTALGGAAYRGQLDAIQLLLENGADVDLVGGGLGTALAAAAYYGTKSNKQASYNKIHAMRLLIKNGADVNLVGGTFGTALGAAACSCNLEATRLLWENAADVTPSLRDLGTHYIEAAYNCIIDAMQLLLQNGADVNLIGGVCGTALGEAAYRGKLDAMRHLLKNGADVNLVGGNYGTALGAAAYNGKLDAMRLLLENGADVNLVGEVTVLSVAAYNGNIDAMRLLFANSVDVNLVGGDLGTALGSAAFNGKLDAMRHLLENGADVNLVGGGYGTALCVAAYNGKLDAMRHLLENGADVNLVAGDYGTALGTAARRFNLEAMRLLLENGADVNLVGGVCGTALGAAVCAGGADGMQLLLENGAGVELFSRMLTDAIINALEKYPSHAKLITEVLLNFTTNIDLLWETFGKYEGVRELLENYEAAQTLN